MSGASLPVHSVVVPVLNEARYIGATLADLIAQAGESTAEILVMDGGSEDGTQAIVAAISASHPIVRLVANPARTQSAACNLAASLAHPDSRLLVRADAHAGYPAAFLRLAVEASVESGATSVVVPMRTIGTSPMQRAIASAQNSRLGNGGSGHRRAGKSGFVDHGHHAVFDLAFFRRLGGYDTSFTHNEDAELDVRVARAGGRIWMCAGAGIDYFPRDALIPLGRQYFRHGKGRARTVGRHRLRLRARQAAPLLILAVVASAPLGAIAWWIALPALLYVGACLSWGGVAAIRDRDPALLGMGVAAIVMHLAWAAGFLVSYASERHTDRAETRSSAFPTMILAASEHRSHDRDA